MLKAVPPRIDSRDGVISDTPAKLYLAGILCTVPILRGIHG